MTVEISTVAGKRFPISRTQGYCLRFWSLETCYGSATKNCLKLRLWRQLFASVVPKTSWTLLVQSRSYHVHTLQVLGNVGARGDPQ